MVRVSGQQDHEGKLTYLGNAIRERRLSYGLSQEAVADAARIDRSHMGKIERGERNVTVLNLLRIAAALDTTAAALLGDAKL